jgi:hypothetical protein
MIKDIKTSALALAYSLIACLFVFGLFPLVAHAAQDGVGVPVSVAAGSPFDLIGAAAGTMIATLLARFLGPDALKGDVAGAILALVVAVIGGAVGMLRGTEPASWHTVGVALMAGVLAMGGWSGLWKRILLPLLAKKWPSLGSK